MCFCVCVLCIFYVYMGRVPEIKHDDDDDDDDILTFALSEPVI